MIICWSQKKKRKKKSNKSAGLPFFFFYIFIVNHSRKYHHVFSMMFIWRYIYILPGSTKSFNFFHWPSSSLPRRTESKSIHTLSSPLPNKRKRVTLSENSPVPQVLIKQINHKNKNCQHSCWFQNNRGYYIPGSTKCRSRIHRYVCGSTVALVYTKSEDAFEYVNEVTISSVIPFKPKNML